jgi:hypothetical protein
MGSYEAKCEGKGVAIRNANVRWKWYDDVDANSWWQSYQRGKLGGNMGETVERLFIEGPTDLVWDKLAGADYKVIVYFHDRVAKERRWHFDTVPTISNH